MTNNVIDLFNLSKDLKHGFLTTHITKNIILLIFFMCLIIFSSMLINYTNIQIQTLYKKSNTSDSTEQQKDRNKYNFIFLLAIIFLIYVVYKFCGTSWNLIECLINPDFIYLKYLINLMK